MPKHTAQRPADIKREEEAEQERKQRRAEELADMKTLLDTPQGLRVFKRYLKRGRYQRLSFTGNSETFFNEGTRAFGLEIEKDIAESNFEAYITITKEIVDEQR